MMLADDTEHLCTALVEARGGEVIVVLDHCGLELVSDLLLVDGLLRCGQSKVKRSRTAAHAAPTRQPRSSHPAATQQP